jgi:2-polyprenyl-3-methyl-5-hydroxy-6-metoxy-1,4-benzoquinol methylase
MDSNPCCPVCRARAWQELGTRKFVDKTDAIPEYIRKRYRVLFDVWFPGKQDITLTSSMCVSCGFVTNLPRVTVDDVDSKYRYLEELGQDYGRDELAKIQRRRSEAIYRACRKLLARRVKVLDYGGGDGRLMTSFVEDGHECFLVDYNQSPVANVRKLSDTVDQLGGEQFDLIICNHVIEHVAEPTAVVRELTRHLSRNGTIFIEVPMEIWRRPPLQDEPVTHCNFFVPGSLRRVLEEAGLNIWKCCLVSYLHPSGRYLPAVQAIAKNGEIATSRASSGVDEVETYLTPTLWCRIHNALIMRQNLVPALCHRLNRKWAAK